MRKSENCPNNKHDNNFDNHLTSHHTDRSKKKGLKCRGGRLPDSVVLYTFNWY